MFSTESCASISCVETDIYDDERICYSNDFALVDPEIEIKECEDDTYFCDLTKIEAHSLYKIWDSDSTHYDYHDIGYCVDYRSTLYLRPPGSTCYAGF